MVWRLSIVEKVAEEEGAGRARMYTIRRLSIMKIVPTQSVLTHIASLSSCANCMPICSVLDLNPTENVHSVLRQLKPPTCMHIGSLTVSMQKCG